MNRNIDYIIDEDSAGLRVEQLPAPEALLRSESVGD